MYRVIKLFTDGQDNLYEYNVGDTYPRKGYKPSKERINGLLGTDNKQGVPLIEEIPEEVPEVVEEVKEDIPDVEETPKKAKKKIKKK